MKDVLHFILKDKWYLLRDVPEEPNEKHFSGDQWKESNALREYNEALQKAKDNAVLVENQDYVCDWLWRNDERITSPIPILYWKENMAKDKIHSLTGYKAEIKELKNQSKCTACKIDCLKNLKGIPCKAPIETVAVISPVEPEENIDFKHPTACDKCFDWKECLEFGCQKPMKDLLQTVQNTVAKEWFAKNDPKVSEVNWKWEFTPHRERLEKLWPEVCKRYAFEVAKGALKNAQENFQLTWRLQEENWESITDESNIKL